MLLFKMAASRQKLRQRKRRPPELFYSDLNSLTVADFLPTLSKRRNPGRLYKVDRIIAVNVSYFAAYYEPGQIPRT